jgi:pyruvate ferredoxin oxidoreductase beta subunit
VTEYLRLQQRFASPVQDDPRARQELEHLQALADATSSTYGLKGTQDDARDSEGADTVRRGGQRWA